MRIRDRLKRHPFFYSFLLLWFLTVTWHQFKPMPAGTVASCDYHPLHDDQIQFLHDITYLNHNGQPENRQTIFDRVFSMIDQAEQFIVMDFFLLNQYRGESGDVYRNLSSELVEHLLQRKLMRPDIQIILITDPINSIYGGRHSPLLSELEQAGIEVVYTDLKQLRDSNPVYSALWRMMFQWFGNDVKTGWLKNPFQKNAGKISLRSWLSLLNFKANHRKLIVADNRSDTVNALITSANPHDASSAHSNVAFYFMGNAAIALLQSELAVAEFSGWDAAAFKPSALRPRQLEASGNIEAACVTEIEIRHTLVDWIEQTEQGDAINIAVFYLSERNVIRSLLSAADRGVSIRLILDANKDAFGRQKNGIPNRSVAHELIQNGQGNIQLRWYQTHGEQFHSKLAMVRVNQAKTPMLYATLGSANYTRRNISNYNLEANLAVRMPAESVLAARLTDYFDRLWHNHHGSFTVDYSAYLDDSKLRYWQYRFMEATGLSSF